MRPQSDECITLRSLMKDGMLHDAVIDARHEHAAIREHLMLWVGHQIATLRHVG